MKKSKGTASRLSPRALHPFPARMAPEIALLECDRLPKRSTILDPMAGSGTVIRVAIERGHRASGFDVDPLAVLIASVFTSPIDPTGLTRAARAVASAARRRSRRQRSWAALRMDRDTQRFVRRWFAERQRTELSALAMTLRQSRSRYVDAMWLAFSSLIITKDKGASLARDVSHSRPHKTMDENDFDVIDNFIRSAKRISAQLKNEPPPTGGRVALGDARHLMTRSHTIDAIITSPPYLNAIDYMRGHRLALVWMGHSVSSLRMIRSGAIGTEVGLDDAKLAAVARRLLKGRSWRRAPEADRRVLQRYLADMSKVFEQMKRVLKPSGRAVVVIGDSRLRGRPIKNSELIRAIARSTGFRLVSKRSRRLPSNRRYLPPPEDGASQLNTRMLTEHVLVFRPRRAA